MTSLRILVAGLATILGSVTPSLGEGRAMPEALDLLTRFCPIIVAENEGYYGGARQDFPYRMDEPIWGSSSYVEDNSETYPGTFSSSKYSVYGVAEYVDEQHTAHAPFWVLQYFVYLAGNYHSGLREWVEFFDPLNPYRGMTHEHDWEWVTILVGESDDLEGDYAPYVAALSGHSRDGLDTFADGRVYLFPCVGVPQEFLLGDPYVSRERRLVGDGDEDCDDQAIVLMAATGNEFQPGPGIGIALGSPAILTTHPASWVSSRYDQLGTGCEQMQTDRVMCYGDPQACDEGAFLEWLGETWICPQCDEICSGNKECDDPRDVPWKRDATWGAAGVPADFRFPLPSEFKINPDGQPQELAAAGATPIRGGWEITWQVECTVSCTFFNVSPQRGTGLVSTPLCHIPAEGAGEYACAISTECPGAEAVKLGDRRWSLPLTEVGWTGLVGHRILVEACKDGETCRGLAVTKELSGSRGSAASEGALEVRPSVATDRALIRFYTSKRGETEVVITSVDGRAVRRLTDVEQGPGWHAVSWDGRGDRGESLCAGVYFVRFLGADASGLHQQVLLIR